MAMPSLALVDNQQKIARNRQAKLAMAGTSI
jgi:hypothetical protein